MNSPIIRSPWVLAAIAAATLPAFAADHNEAPGTLADHSADIDDVYAWHDGDTIVAIVTFGGPGGDPAADPGAYDADLLYQLHLDNDGDFTSDLDVSVRFGQNPSGDWGVQVEGLPGASGTLVGPVDTAIDAGSGRQVQAGTFDDPFFFDLTGFKDTLTTGTLAFDNSRDSFAGKNVRAIVLEMDAATATGAGTLVRLWATTGRK
jgi:Domain of unknown function (DUF4331)